MRTTQAVLPPKGPEGAWWASVYASTLGVSAEGLAAEHAAQDAEGLIALRHRLRTRAGRILGGRTWRCGRHRTSQVVSLWRRPDGGCYFAGLETCGSIWACPVCAAKIAEGRRRDIEAVLAAALELGGAGHMATLTIPHARLDAAGALRSAVATAWRKVQQGAGWKRLKKRFGVAGLVRALEVTHGDFGWHPHLHVLFVGRPLSDKEQRAFHALLFRRWRKRVGELLSGKPCAFAATDFRPATAADYVAKWGAPAEIAKAASKISRKGGRSPWQLLADADAGDRQAARLFAEYAAAFKGARHLTWSRGLRETLGLYDEPTDEQLAEREAEIDPELPLDDGGGVGVIGHFDKGTWGRIEELQLTGKIAEAGSRGGWRAVLILLKRHGLGSYFTPDELAKPRSWRPPVPGWLPVDFEHPRWDEHAAQRRAHVN